MFPCVETCQGLRSHCMLNTRRPTGAKSPFVSSCVRKILTPVAKISLSLLAEQFFGSFNLPNCHVTGAWAAGAIVAENPRAAQYWTFSVPRYCYFVHVDRRALQSVLSAPALDPESKGFVNFVDFQ